MFCELYPQISNGAEFNPLKNSDIVQLYTQVSNELCEAGTAAAITTVIAGTINTVSCLDKVKKGEMTPQEATLYILKNTIIAVYI